MFVPINEGVAAPHDDAGDEEVASGDDNEEAPADEERAEEEEEDTKAYAPLSTSYPSTISHFASES
jgi:hypothetical protein